jgi:DNA-binding transcriptional LysR family regulator
MLNIRNIDLNLFVVFEALMQERNVTRAAARLGLSQPAVSSALKRLRENLGDALLVRTRGGMRPTPRAEQIFGSVAQLFDQIQSAIQTGVSFTPATTERSFNVMMSDIGEIVYLPRLIHKLQREAPGVRLSVRRLSRPRVQEDLASGAVDLAVGWIDRTGDLRRDDLFREDFVCIVRPDHPRVRRRLTLKQFMSEWHLGVGRHDLDATAKAEDGTPDAGFAKATQGRKIAMQVPHFLAVPNIIAHTDLLCVVPRQLGQAYADLGQVRIVTLPLAADSFTVSLVWHRRFELDPGSLWLRGVLKQLFTH